MLLRCCASRSTRKAADIQNRSALRLLLSPLTGLGRGGGRFPHGLRHGLRSFARFAGYEAGQSRLEIVLDNGQLIGYAYGKGWLLAGAMRLSVSPLREDRRITGHGQRSASRHARTGDRLDVLVVMALPARPMMAKASRSPDKFLKERDVSERLGEFRWSEQKFKCWKIRKLF